MVFFLKDLVRTQQNDELIQDPIEKEWVLLGFGRSLQHA
jgi:hypothetical protein